MESRKPKSPRKNQKLGTIVHLPARMDAILKKIILTLQAASAYTHFRGGVMGSNADFMENGFKPEEYVYPINSSKIKNRHETFINPTKIHENKTPSMFFHPASIGDGPRPPLNPQNHEKSKFIYKIWGPWRPWVSLNLFHQPYGEVIIVFESIPVFGLHRLLLRAGDILIAHFL